MILPKYCLSETFKNDETRYKSGFHFLLSRDDWTTFELFYKRPIRNSAYHCITQHYIAITSITKHNLTHSGMRLTGRLSNSFRNNEWEVGYSYINYRLPFIIFFDNVFEFISFPLAALPEVVLLSSFAFFVILDMTFCFAIWSEVFVQFSFTKIFKSNTTESYFKHSTLFDPIGNVINNVLAFI